MEDNNGSAANPPKLNPQTFFEKLLWAFRWVVILGVLANLLGGIAMIMLAVSDCYHALQEIFSYLTGNDTTSEPNHHMLTLLVEMVDRILMAGVLFIFAFGLYELFISKMDVNRQNGEGKILNINSIDELKSKLMNLIIMMLVVKLFSFLTNANINHMEDAILYSGAIALIALSSLLIHWAGHDKKNKH
ncbi:YqhA family protein [uncultured Endozoicomonas sp.]|uniref:YqhA family protein n=1 Tax=uncultured Endozoicomonas sp. TaxID=432652 RepID=UPI002616A8D3|nr:YqhA family protein [uncultured Endozoicomonas sp.]